MDVVFVDCLWTPRRLITEVHLHGTYRYTAVSADGESCYLECYCMTRDEWLAYLERFRDELTGKEFREAREQVVADCAEPDSWAGFRSRYALTGDPYQPNTERTGGAAPSGAASGSTGAMT